MGLLSKAMSATRPAESLLRRARDLRDRASVDPPASGDSDADLDALDLAPEKKKRSTSR